MAVIDIMRFRGELPSRNPHQNNPDNAVTTRNAVIDDAGVRPIRQLLTDTTLPALSGATTLFRSRGGKWVRWSGAPKHAVRSFAAADAYGRIYYTGDGPPRVTDESLLSTAGYPPTAGYRLGVAAPTAPPASVVSGSGAGTAEARFYVYTYVDNYGAEGPPSPVSNELTVLPGQTVNVTVQPPPGPPYNIVAARIYRTNTSGTTSMFQFVDEVAITSSSTAVTVTDAKAAADLGEALPSEFWDEPPDDMVGLTTAAPGVLAGFRNNQVLFSEVGAAHAWPIEYRRSLENTIVALSPMARGMAILTDGQPYYVSGSNPASYSIARIPAPYACVSANSVVSFSKFVVYASDTGLVLMDNTSAAILTEGMIVPRDWAKMNPDSIIAARWNDKYVFQYTGESGETEIIIIDPRAPEEGLSRMNSADVTAMYTDPSTARLFVIANGFIAEWDAGDAIHGTWVSATRYSLNPVLMAVAQVDADEYPVVLTVWRDGVEQARFEVKSPMPVRVPRAVLGRAYAVGVYTKHRVGRIRLASTMSEFKE